MPRQSSTEYELWQCCQTLRQALVDTIADIDRGRIEGDTIDRDVSFIRTQLGRRDVLLSVLAQRRAYRAQVHPEYITGDWPPPAPAADPDTAADVSAAPPYRRALPATDKGGAAHVD